MVGADGDADAWVSAERAMGTGLAAMAASAQIGAACVPEAQLSALPAQLAAALAAPVQAALASHAFSLVAHSVHARAATGEWWLRRRRG
ncbi:MAG: hypothetical protein IPL75_12875 [Acidobacteria bacterium]|nr:hypothetical protein [Acidobacteriota bacterium]